MNDLVIRLAGPKDAAEMVEVRRLASLEAYVGGAITEQDINNNNNSEKAAYVESKIKDGAMKFWVATKNGHIVGTCCAHTKEDLNRIWFWYVLPDFQGLGVGQLLLQKALKYLGRSKDVKIEVVSYNKQLIKYYESLGFVTSQKGDVWELETGKNIPETILLLPAVR